MSKSVIILFFLVILIVLSSCHKEEFTVEVEAITQNSKLSSKSGQKVTICHGGNKILSVSSSALAAHIAHGDVILEDLDGDGYFPDNGCGYGPMGDCDDTDPSVYPDAPEICDDNIDNDCDGDIDEDDDDCITNTTFVYASNFDDSNELGFQTTKGCLPLSTDYGNGATAGVDGGIGLVSVGASCTNFSQYVNVLDEGKLSFDLSAVCNNCIDGNAFATLNIYILNDDGLNLVVTVNTDMYSENWLFGTNNDIISSYNNPTVINNPVSHVEVQRIPAGWSAVVIEMSGNHIAGNGEVWAIDNVVLENM